METIDDIVRDARIKLELYNEYYDWEGYIEKLLPRIEAVFARCAEINEKQDIENHSLRAECELWRKQALEENGALDVARAENEKLRTALKPVLECDLNSPNIMKSWGAVRDAQRIYNESEVK